MAYVYIYIHQQVCKCVLVLSTWNCLPHLYGHHSSDKESEHPFMLISPCSPLNPAKTGKIGRDEQSSLSVQFSSVQLLSPVRLFATPWITALQASLSITNSWSLLKLTSESVVKTLKNSLMVEVVYCFIGKTPHRWLVLQLRYT